MKSNRQYRTMQMRAKDGEEYTVRGYATTFNQQYTLYDWGDYEVREQVDSNAFKDCDMSDVIMQYDHEGRVFARNRNKTLTVGTDENGLYVEAYLGGTELGRSLYEDIKGGYIDRMSFGFSIDNDGGLKREYITENHKEVCLRTVLKASKLYDVSAVSIPANDMTSISARKVGDGEIELLKAERLKRAKQQLRIKLKLLED